jgi:hypothetical protein
VRSPLPPPLEVESAFKLDGPLTPEPTGPGATNRRRQNKLIPEFAQLIDVYEESDVLLGPFSQNLLVYTDSIRPSPEVVAHSGFAPADVKRQFHDAGRFHQVLESTSMGTTTGLASGPRTALRVRAIPEAYEQGPLSAADHPNSIPTMESPDVPLRPCPSEVRSSIAP